MQPIYAREMSNFCNHNAGAYHRTFIVKSLTFLILFLLNRRLFCHSKALTHLEV